MNRVARTAFWTLCVCAYILEVWYIIALLSGIHLLPFDNAGYIVFAGQTKDVQFTGCLWFIVSVAMLPLVYFLRRSRRIVLWGLGIWLLPILYSFLPVY